MTAIMRETPVAGGALLDHVPEGGKGRAKEKAGQMPGLRVRPKGRT